MMTFGQAISSGFKNYSTWKGRATRAEYWWWYLFTVIVTLPFNIWYQSQVIWTGAYIPGTTEQVSIIFGPSYWILMVISLALLLPSLAMIIRRLHDQNKSGGYFWFVLIPIAGPIILLVFMLLPSDPAGSRFDA